MCNCMLLYCIYNFSLGKFCYGAYPSFITILVHGLLLLDISWVQTIYRVCAHVRVLELPFLLGACVRFLFIRAHMHLDLMDTSGTRCTDRFSHYRRVHRERRIDYPRVRTLSPIQKKKNSVYKMSTKSVGLSDKRVPDWCLLCGLLALPKTRVRSALTGFPCTH